MIATIGAYHPEVRPHVDVEIWSDVVCPWCYIGKRRFEAAVADVGRRDRRRASCSARTSSTRRRRPARPARSSTPTPRSSADTSAPRRSSTTSPRWPPRAGSISEWIAPCGPTPCLLTECCGSPRRQATSVALKERLLQAYFIDGLDVGDPEVLATCAAEVGLDHDRVLAFLEQRRRAGRGRPRTADGRSRWTSPPCRRSCSTASGWCQVLRTLPRSSRCCAVSWPDEPPMSDWQRLDGELAAWRRGEGPRLVFVHGFTQTSTSWKPIADDFAARGYEAIVVDAPGHGDSTAIRADLYHAAELVTASAATRLHRLQHGWTVVPARRRDVPRRRSAALALIGASPGIADEGDRAHAEQPTKQLADHIEQHRCCRRSSTNGWQQPLFAGLVVDRRNAPTGSGTPPPGWPSSLRLRRNRVRRTSLWPRLGRDDHARSDDGGRARRRGSPPSAARWPRPYRRVTSKRSPEPATPPISRPPIASSPC